MRKRDMERIIREVRARVAESISYNAAGSRIAGALSGEGYHGGYRDALNDILLLLNDVMPKRRGWWEGDNSR